MDNLKISIYLTPFKNLPTKLFTWQEPCVAKKQRTLLIGLPHPSSALMSTVTEPTIWISSPLMVARFSQILCTPLFFPLKYALKFSFSFKSGI